MTCSLLSCDEGLPAADLLPHSKVLKAVHGEAAALDVTYFLPMRFRWLGIMVNGRD